jgi:hypothetical protein
VLVSDFKSRPELNGMVMEVVGPADPPAGSAGGGPAAGNTVGAGKNDPDVRWVVTAIGGDPASGLSVAAKNLQRLRIKS